MNQLSSSSSSSHNASGGSYVITDARYATPLHTGDPRYSAAPTDAPLTNAPNSTPIPAPTPVDPALTHRMRLDDLRSRAERLRTEYDQAAARQTDPPDPQLSEAIVKAAEAYNKVCAQYQEVSRQWEQARADVSENRQTPTDAGATQDRKRPATEGSLQEQTHKQRRTTDPTADSSSDEEAPLSQWGPARAINAFASDNAARLQEELDQPTINAFVLIGGCDSIAGMYEAIPKLKAVGFASLLATLLARKHPPLTEAAGQLALTMLLYYCANKLVLHDLNVTTMSLALSGLDRYPKDEEYQLQATTFARLAEQPQPIQEAFATLLNRSLQRD